MKSKVIVKIVIGVLVIGGGVCYFMVQAMQSSWSYYYSVDDFAASKDKDPGDSYRLEGRIKKGSVDHNVDTMTLNFILAGATAEIPVTYKGVVPDNFEEGREVVAEGRLAKADLFKADTLITRCESKYQAKVN